VRRIDCVTAVIPRQYQVYFPHAVTDRVPIAHAFPSSEQFYQLLADSALVISSRVRTHIGTRKPAISNGSLFREYVTLKRPWSISNVIKLWTW